MIAFFYFNYFFLLPRLTDTKGWRWYVPTLGLALIIITAVPNMFIPDDHGLHRQIVVRHADENQSVSHRHPFNGKPPGHFHAAKIFHHIGHNLWLFLVIVLFSLTLFTLIRLRTLQRTKLDAELTLLKSQIHPHFLFNTLNSIYGSALDEKAPLTGTAVMRLSGILRYVLEENKDEFIPLERELSFLKDYIDLQKLRLGDTVSVWFDVNGDPSGLKIAPLLLITFVENAYRHGASPEEHSEIRFVMDITAKTIEFSATNRRMELWKNNTSMGSLSLDKIRERLENYYPQRHLLLITDQGEDFRVVLNIQLK